MDTSTSVVHSLAQDKNISRLSIILFAVLLVFILLGIGTGYLIAQITTKQSVSPGSQTANTSSVRAGTMYGSNDTIFKDTAEGVLQAGGIKGEGQYHLVRPGGDSQNVYITSSVLDLSQFVGHTLKVWGQTQQAQYAGWLMDAGKVEVEK